MVLCICVMTVLRVALGLGTIPGWSRAGQVGGAGAGGDVGLSRGGLTASPALVPRLGMRCLHPMGWSCCTLLPHSQRAPKPVPVTTRATSAFLCRDTLAAVMPLFRIKGTGNTTNRKSKRTKGKEQRQLGSSDTWTDTEHGSRAATWHGV